MSQLTKYQIIDKTNSASQNLEYSANTSAVKTGEVKREDEKPHMDNIESLQGGYNNEKNNIYPSQSDKYTNPLYGDGLRGVFPMINKYVMEDSYISAICLCEQTLKNLKKSYGRPEHPEIAAMLNITSFVYRCQKNYKKAAKLLKQALSIWKATLGEHHVKVADTLHYLADLYVELEEFQRAVKLYNDALTVLKVNFGENHMLVAKTLNKLADLSSSHRKHKDAEGFRKHATEIREKLTSRKYR